VPARIAWAWVLHPAVLVALLVLALNDHVLKTAWPGTVTGKLSDVAGLVLAPAVIAAALATVWPRLPLRAVAIGATAAVGAGFTLVKLTATGALAASTIWSTIWRPGTIRCDPTDLLALPALAVSWWALSQARRHPAPQRLADRVRIAVVLPVAGLAIIATSAGEYPDAGRVLVKDGALMVDTGSYYGYDNADGEHGGLVMTRDGRTWSNVPQADPVRRVASRASSCVPAQPRHCFRVVPGRLAVQESLDGGVTWTDAWSVSPDRQKFLSRAYPEARPDGASVAAQSVGVLPVGEQFVVVVSIGRDGILERHPDGRWERIGFPTMNGQDLGWVAVRAPQPLTDPGRRIAGECIYVGLIAAVALLVGGLVASRSWRRTWWVAPVASTGFVWVVGPISVGGAVLGVSSVTAAVVLLAIGLLIWWFLAWRCGLGLWPTTVLAVLGVVFFVVVMLPFVAWSGGRIDSYEAAVRSATYLVAGGFGAMVLAAAVLNRLTRYRPPPLRPPGPVRW
jgi:hypothetical protein